MCSITRNSDAGEFISQVSEKGAFQGLILLTCGVGPHHPLPRTDHYRGNRFRHIARIACRARRPVDWCLHVRALRGFPFIGTKFTENEKVRKLTFTGATSVGKILMLQGADEIMKRGAELGGNAPFIVFDRASRRVRA
uniref:Aldehyde dehydrogenase domain-containing protein n=1 Tax=Rhizobium leguminosarum TaxID=384 RepID=A0A179BW97_RHILE|nr:hypothetical protein A4U53_38775 [Rhizobium leguminosarum]